MRGGVRRRQVEDEEESAFVSMTDMTVSFLFIVMILLAFFASQIQSKDIVPRGEFDRVVGERDAALAAKTALEKRVVEKDARIAALEAEIEALRERLRRMEVKDPIETYLAQVSALRSQILHDLQARLTIDFPDLQVVVSEEMDALRFKGDGLFVSGSSTLAPDKRRIIESIASRLNQVLPCYTLGASSAWTESCNPIGAVIEAVQIEGHTDSTGDDNSNLILSTARADETFFAMTDRQPNLVRHLNSRAQPVLSVAGYGEMRPVAENSIAEGRATNRRIDLRIIMYTPRSADEISAIRDRLRQGVSGGLAQ